MPLVQRLSVMSVIVSVAWDAQGPQGKATVTRTGMTTSEIVFCLDAADQIKAEIEKLRKEEDYFRWRAAELITAQLDAGKSQRALAQEIGRSQSLVSFMAQVWRRFSGDYLGDGSGNRPLFQDAYRHVQKGRPVHLDCFVPTRDDDEDAREVKGAVLLFYTEPSKFADEVMRPAVHKWLARFSTECRRCGHDHKSSAARLATRAIQAMVTILSDDSEEPDEKDLLNFWLITSKPEVLVRKCAREPITRKSAR